MYLLSLPRKKTTLNTLTIVMYLKREKIEKDGKDEAVTLVA